MAYLKNTLQNFDRLTIKMDDIENKNVSEIYSISDYTSLDKVKMNDFINSLDSTMFDWYQLQNNSNLEKVALDLYGNPDYWDILIVVNHRNPLFEFPYDYDTLTNIVESDIADYISNVYGKDLTNISYNALYENYKNKMVADAEIWRIIKIVKPSKIYEFIQRGYEAGVFQ